MNPLTLPLTTERLRLRPYQESDAEALLPIYSRADVARFLLGDPWTAEVARKEIAKRLPRLGLETPVRGLALVIELIESDENASDTDSADATVIGDICLWLEGGGEAPDDDGDDGEDGSDGQQSESDMKAEIGWVLDPAQGGKGYATEAATAILDAAFDHYGLHRVMAQMDARNTASAKLAARVGMTQEAHLRADWWSKGEWTDTLIFGMLDSDRAGSETDNQS